MCNSENCTIRKFPERHHEFRQKKSIERDKNVLSNRPTDQFVSGIVDARSCLVHEKDLGTLEDGACHAKQLFFPERTLGADLVKGVALSAPCGEVVASFRHT